MLTCLPVAVADACLALTRTTLTSIAADAERCNNDIAGEEQKDTDNLLADAVAWLLVANSCELLPAHLELYATLSYSFTVALSPADWLSPEQLTSISPNRRIIQKQLQAMTDLLFL